jgi:hypothetical protein
VKGSILKQSKTENNDRILDYREETNLSTRSYMYNKLYIQKHKKTEYKMIDLTVLHTCLHVCYLVIDISNLFTYSFISGSIFSIDHIVEFYHSY